MNIPTIIFALLSALCAALAIACFEGKKSASVADRGTHTGWSSETGDGSMVIPTPPPDPKWSMQDSKYTVGENGAMVRRSYIKRIGNQCVTIVHITKTAEPGDENLSDAELFNKYQKKEILP